VIYVAPLLGQILAATRPDALTFVWAAVAIIAGALGVVVARNPVHSALMLILTLFGVAVIFIELQANFLAAVQVIVYAGAIVVLFLFVIMLLGVDKEENLETEPLWGQRPVAVALVVLALAGVLALGIEAHWAVGAHAVAGARNQTGGDVAALGRSVFTTYLFPFEVTSALLVIAVVGAVILSRKPNVSPTPDFSPASPDGSTPASPAETADGSSPASQSEAVDGGPQPTGEPEAEPGEADAEAEVTSGEEART
jgi:NADH-quinone oxidoreductase subunit J